MHTLIQLNQVSAGYNGRNVLENATLSVYENDFLGVIGPTGGGKTTLMRVLLGLMKPTVGTVSYFDKGRPVSKITMGYLPQHSDIDRKFPISVYDVVLSGLSSEKPLLRPFNKYQRDKTTATLERMGLADLAKRPIGTLSGGQLQRVLLARAVVSQPKVLILDEPNTYIDQRFQEKMYDMLETLNRHCAIIIVSHDIGTILQNVKDVACVNRTLHYHPTTELSPEHLAEEFGGPIEMLGHGSLPRIQLREHEDKPPKIEV